MKTLHTVQEAAGKLKVNARTVYRLLKEGELRSAKVGGSIRISDEMLEEFIANNSTPIRADGESAHAV